MGRIRALTLVALLAVVLVFSVLNAPGDGNALSAPSSATAPREPSQTPRPGAWWEAEEGWSEPVNGLKIRISASHSLTKYLCLQVTLAFWQTAPGGMSVPASCDMVAWEVRDANGSSVAWKPTDDSNSQYSPRWIGLSDSSRSGTGMVLDNEDSCDGKLILGKQQWKLVPGDYTLHCTFEASPAKLSAMPRPSRDAWTGKIVAVPAKFSVYPEVSDAELQRAAAAIRAKPHNRQIDLWQELADLFHPGMTVRQLRAVFKFSAGSIVDWNGNCWFSHYWLDEGYVLEASGSGIYTKSKDMPPATQPTTRVSEVPCDSRMVMENRPKVVPVQERLCTTQTAPTGSATSSAACP